MRCSLLVLCFHIVYSVAIGQVMMPVQTTMRTPMGNVPLTHYVPTGIPYNYATQVNISHKHHFVMVLADGTVFDYKTRIDISGKQHRLVVKKEGETMLLKPADTKQVFRMTDNGKKLVGIPADTCWLFKSKPGPIHQYSFLAEEDSNYIVAVQKGDDGEILPLTKETLLAILENRDIKMNRLIDEGYLRKAVVYYNKKMNK